MKNWMRELALHYEIIRNNHPDDKLLILFDIDGTILDLRYTVRALLKSYDSQFGTRYFSGLTLADIDFPEENLEQGLLKMGVEYRQIGHVLDWYGKNRWTTWALNEAHSPFPGVLDVIRWFQLHRNTFVGLNTGRIERLREQTLFSLNRLGKEFRVRFDNELLMMNRAERKTDIAASKVDAIRTWRQKGYRVVAVIDNEPDNLEVIGQMENAGEILLLHAGSLFSSRRSTVPARAVNGNIYDLTELARFHPVPRHTQLVWTGIQNNILMDSFFASNIRWADITDLVNRVYYARQFCVQDTSTEGAMHEQILGTMAEMNRGARLDLVSEFINVNSYLELVRGFGIHPELLWFRVTLDRFNREDIRRLAGMFPGAIIECKADFLGSLVTDRNPMADEMVSRFSQWGVNRFGVSWNDRKMKQMLEWLDDGGHEVVLNDVYGYDAFLQAVLLGPRAIASDFSFPDMLAVTEPLRDFG